MKHSSLPIVCAMVCVLIASSSVHAALVITNGDFETAPAEDFQTDVTGWFDYDGDGLAWWQQTSSDANVNISPFPGSSQYLFLSGATDFNYWAYQSIGTNSEGLDALPIQFDAGTLADAGGDIDRTLTFAVYESDGTFTGAENSDIDGAAGVSMIDSFNVTTGPMSPSETATFGGTLDLGLVNPANELFLRISNSRVADGPQYTGIDNVMIIPEPGTYAVLMGLAGLCFVVIRRRRT